MNILVTGSSGAIGKVAVKYFIENHFNVYGIDIRPSDFSDKKYTHKIIDIRQKDILNDYIGNLHIHTVCHLAAHVKVDESETCPSTYYQNNVIGSINILDSMVNNQIKNIIFASTAAVYGFSNLNDDFKETDECKPASVYGKTKLMSEYIIKDYVRAYGINAIVFRFFNVGGTADTDRPYHLIPLIVNRLCDNSDIFINGTDYDTSDGTCVRDYIHVLDICHAFLLATQNNLEGFSVFNLGSGTGYTVREIISACVAYSKSKSKIIIRNRRPGDPDILVADTDKILQELSWIPIRSLEEIITDTMSAYDIKPIIYDF